jgi:NAD(P)-dependent dehydrogenase (short-subunit alcohol dehydrogenase family)
MIFKNENALVHGAGDAVTAAVARTFTREDTKDILVVGGVAEAPEVDALDEHAVDAQV